VYSIKVLPRHHGRGRPYSRSIRIVRPDLKYAQLVRHRDKHGNIISLERKVIYGEELDVKASLILSSFKKIGTSHAERQNLSIRNYGKRFARKTICYSKNEDYLTYYIEILQAWFNFTKLHEGLRMRNLDGSHTHRTPAMAHGLTKTRLKWQDILRWRRNLCS